MKDLYRLLGLAQRAEHGSSVEFELERQQALERGAVAVNAVRALIDASSVALAKMNLAMANDHSCGPDSGVRHEHCENLRRALAALES